MARRGRGATSAWRPCGATTPTVSRIVDVASQVALYTFGHRANEWVHVREDGVRGEAGAGRAGTTVPRGPLGPATPTARPGPPPVALTRLHGARTGLSPEERVGHLARPSRPARRTRTGHSPARSLRLATSLRSRSLQSLKATHKSENTRSGS